MIDKDDAPIHNALQDFAAGIMAKMTQLTAAIQKRLE
jgi:hypothetical protein